MTAAVRALLAAGASFSDHVYDYRDHGGTAWAAEALGLDERAVIKTLVMEDERRAPLVMLMHGDREVSTRALARAMGVGSVRPCAPDVAERHSGYKVGGTSPFGLRKVLPIYMEASIAASRASSSTAASAATSSASTGRSRPAPAAHRASTPPGCPR